MNRSESVEPAHSMPSEAFRTAPLPRAPKDLEASGLRPAPSSSFTITFVVRTLALVFAEGLSVGLFIWAMLPNPDVVPYALDNRLPLPARQAVLGWMFGTAAAGVLVAVAYLAAAKAQPLRRLNQLAARLAPLIGLGFLPFLLRWQIWHTRELTFGVLVTALAFGTHTMLQTALSAPPLLGSIAARVSSVVQRKARSLQRWLPLTLVLLGIVGYSAFFSYHTVANHHNLRTSSFDLGLEENIIWNLLHGGEFMKSSPLSGPVGSHFGYHATLFAYVIVPFYAIYQHAETLLVFQAILLGAAALPLFLLARRQLSAWAACVVAIAYLFYPPLHGSNLYDFHYLPLGVFFLWLTLFLVESGRMRWAALATILTLSVREDVAAGLVIIGAYLVLTGRRPRAGLILSIVAGSYFVLMKMVLMPRALGDSSFVYMFQGLLPPGERGYGGVLKTVIANPVFTLTNLLETEKLLYVVQLGAPLAFFPWRRPIGWLCTLPGFFFTLLATGYLPLVQISFQYTTHWTAFLFLAVISNLAWLRRAQYPGDVGGTVRQRAWLATIALLTLITTHQYGVILQQNTARGGFGRYTFGTTEQDRARYQALKALIAKVPKDAKIVGSENVVPHLSNRADAYTLRVGLFDAAYLLAQWPAGGEELTALRRALRDENFGVMEISDGLVLAKRGHSRTRNKEVLRY